MPDRNQFCKSARNKITAAGILCNDDKKLPTEAAYLCMVALECAIKRRILSKNNFKCSEDIPNDHNFSKLFNTSLGHNIEVLANKTKINLRIDGKIRQRVFNSLRPYSLRYGSEQVSLKHGKEEYLYAEQIVNDMEKEQ